MDAFVHGFSDELTKVARFRAVAKFLERIKRSPDLRASIRRSAALGAGTGAATGLLAGDENKGAVRRMLSGAAVGGLGGAITGSAFPGWFGKANMRAPDEVKGSLFRRSSRH